MDIQETLPPEDLIQPPKDTTELLEEVDLLDVLPKDQEIDIKPEVQEAEYALQMQNPALEGEPADMTMDDISGFELEADLPELGKEPTQLKPAAVGQITVDPGATEVDDDEIGKLTEDLIKRGAGGKSDQGTLDGLASLDDLLDLPQNILLSKKTMLPSDLLFEFNSAELRESAKVGLMKLALLIDRNPGMFCWIEGHTDMVGGDDFNLNLSTRRAEAVKSYLVDSLKMDPAKIITRGFGRFEPLVTTGTTEEQAINRRVEIKMRKEPPTGDQLKIAPKKATVIEEKPAPKPEAETPPPPKAVLVKPKRALPVEGAEPPRAAPVPTPEPPKATPVETPQRAVPVEE
jgi:outer membrane protein OmpA-like peptidoglycan-associated protein